MEVSRFVMKVFGIMKILIMQFCLFQHYELDRENLQLLALRLSCRAHSLHNELCQETDSQPVSTQTLADVANVITAVKPLVCWLDR
jgi:connector enhancer of kinase suppressor of Ras 2